jgi:acetyltransferase-like isoleucine patch superfamily enzyme
MLGVKYGKKCSILGKIYISGKGKIEIGDNFTFVSSGYVNPLCRNNKGAIYTSTESSLIKIGDNVGISSSCIWAQKNIFIGNNVNIGADCILIDNDAHPLDCMKRRPDFLRDVGWIEYLKNVSAISIIIENDVWIGARCQILKGVHIGARSIIAAGSVVTKDVPSDVVAGGIPCKVIRPI